MGVELRVAAVWIACDREPDWIAAARAVRDLSLATIWGTGDDFFPWEDWLDEVDNVPHPLGVYQGIRRGQKHLRTALEGAQGVIERGTHNVLVAELPQHRVYVTGGEAGGDGLPEPWDFLVTFCEGGLATAAGFDGWTRFCEVDPGCRRLEFSNVELRSVAAVRALVYAEDLAAEGGESWILSGARGGWLEAWTAPLRADRGRDDDVRALMLFAARTYALLRKLLGEDAYEDDLPFGVPRVVSEMREVLHPEEGLADVPVITDAVAAVEKSLALSEQFTADLLLLEADANEAEPETSLEPPLAEEVAIEIMANLFAWLLIAIGDLANDRLAHAARPVRRVRGFRGWRQGRVIHPAFEDYLGWVAAERLDLVAATRAVEALDDPSLREQLMEDLTPLSELTLDRYSRLIRHTKVGGLRLWFTAGEWRDGWTLNQPLRRLGAAGILRAAGAVAWSPPLRET